MQVKRFRTFEGVFTPCLLSILGVIMYLRLGWVVGKVGLGAALIIIGFANLITFITALSMSSVVTNIRIGTGGAYSIITKSLGVEAGGAIGIPLYLSQAISGAFYITGFTECWMAVFPSHYPLLVSLILWMTLLFVSYYSTKLAFRIQYGVLAIVILSLFSIFLGQDRVAQNPTLWSGFSYDQFWDVFAIFFPAVTGVLAGAAMSGELVKPKESIPKGSIWAIGVSFGIYVALAVWFAYFVPRYDLVTDTSIVIEAGRWRWLVIAGIMGATLSSALNMFVASPRTLLALGKHSVVPLSPALRHINNRGEPSTAILFTGLLALITILFGTLNQVAGLLTMIFLITYGMINLTVFIEQTIGIVSFRPIFRLPRIISFLGSAGCLAVMFIINVQFTLLAIFLIVGIYFLLLRREVKVHSPDVRSGLLLFIAEQLAKESSKLPYHPKIWKPNLLIPVKNTEEFSKNISFIEAIVHPSGRIMLFSIISREDSQAGRGQRTKLDEELKQVVQPLKDEGIFIRSSIAEAPDYISGSITIMQSSKGLYFPSNTFFYTLSDNQYEDDGATHLIKKAEEEGLAVVVLYRHPQLGFAQEEIINLWIRQKTPNIDLSILIALQLEKNWEGKVRLIQIVSSKKEAAEAQGYLERITTLMRLPPETEVKVLVGEFKDMLKEAPPADINIFGMPQEPDLKMIRDVFQLTKTSVLFLRDSEHESAVA